MDKALSMTGRNLEQPSSGMLDDLTVLDFTRVLAGPYCTRLMADLGAEIIKIERPGGGDEMRRSPAVIVGDGEQSTYFVRRNAGKKSVAIDLSSDNGRAIAHDLVQHADVVVENFMPGVVDKLGIGYADLKSIKPDLVYCSISGYGQIGPMSRRGAFAHVVAAASGLMHLDTDAAGPRSSHGQAADALAGAHGFGAILAALWRRQRTGQGALIDVSMLESLMASEDLSFGTVPNGFDAMPCGPRVGMGLSQVHGRWIAWQSAGAPSLWARLCAAMERPELLDDERFATPDARREHWPAAHDVVSAWLMTFANVASALEALTHARVPCALVRSVEEVVACEHLAHRGAFHPVAQQDVGEVLVTSSPYWIDEAPVQPARAAPYQVGEHTFDVLTEQLGYSAHRIARLAEAGTIETPVVGS